MIFQLLSLILSYRVLPAGVSWILHCQATSSLITSAHVATCNFLLDNPGPAHTLGLLCGTEQEDQDMVLFLWISEHFISTQTACAFISVQHFESTYLPSATMHLCYKNPIYFFIYLLFSSLLWKNLYMKIQCTVVYLFVFGFFFPPKKQNVEVSHSNISWLQKVWAALGAAQQCWVLGNRIPFASGRDKWNLLFWDTNATGLGRSFSRAGVPF